MKQTEIGLIPDDWEVKSLGEIATFQGGSQPDISFFSNIKKKNYIRLIQIRDYKTDKYATYIPISLARRFCLKDDIMIGRYGPPIFQILRGLEGAYNVALIKTVPHNVFKEFYYYVLNDFKLFSFIELLSRRSSGQTGVDLAELKKYKIPFPPLNEEQQRIAKALSDVDALISTTEKLIQKKKNIKQGTMQNLLTGKKRLPGFAKSTEYKQTELGLIPEDWEVKEFNQVATLINGRAYSQSELLKQGKYKVLRVGNFGTNDTWYYSNLELPEKQYCNKGDLLYCWSCTYGAYIWNEDNTIYHYHIWKIQINNADKYYLKYILNNDIASQMSNSNGSTMAHITKSFLEKRLFIFPPLIEQTAIANVLSSMDKEIETLNTKLEKYRNLKTAMMQQLLTGKIRLIK